MSVNEYFDCHSGPKYRHDCEACVWVGRYNDADWYVCEGGSSWKKTKREYSPGSVIGRSSSVPSEYWSMPVAMIENPDQYKLVVMDIAGNNYVPYPQLAIARAVLAAYRERPRG